MKAALIELLTDLESYMDNKADLESADYGAMTPNKEAGFLARISEALRGLGAPDPVHEDYSFIGENR